MAKQKINAKQLVADIKSGFTFTDLAAKHSLSAEKLGKVIQLLNDKGHIDQAQVDRLIPSWKCPNCGSLQKEEPPECAQCGIIVSKFRAKQAREKQIQDALAEAYLGQGVAKEHLEQSANELFKPEEKLLAAFSCTAIPKEGTPSFFKYEGVSRIHDYLLVTDKRVVVWTRKQAHGTSDGIYYADLLTVERPADLADPDEPPGLMRLNIRDGIVSVKDMDSKDLGKATNLIREQIKRVRPGEVDRIHHALSNAHIGKSVKEEHIEKAIGAILDPAELLLAAFHCHVLSSEGYGLLARDKGGFRIHDYLLVTDSRVVFWARGMLSGSTDGFQFEDISSVEEARGLLTGEIVLNIRGAKERASAMVKEDVPIAAKMIRDVIQKAKAAKSEGGISVAQQVNQSIPDQIKQLAELRGQGILTEEEFATKKAELLKKM
ncbi:PH domain-containing protein [Thermodesulfobacteriota bacterium]